VLSHQLAAVDRRLIMPFDPLTQMEDVGRVVQLLPALRQIGFDDEGARPNRRTDFMPHQPAVDEAESGLCPDIDREVWVKVHRVKAADAEDATTLGRSLFFTPERRRAIEGPGGERRTGRQAGFQQLTTAHTVGVSWIDMSCLHGYSSLYQNSVLSQVTSPNPPPPP